MTAAVRDLTTGWGPLCYGLRVEDWMPRLEAWARKRVGDAFEWGQTDCNVLALEAVDIQRGTETAALLRGKYHSHLGAQRFQLRESWDLGAVLAGAGLRPVVPGEALELGDIVFAEQGGFACSHVVLGQRYALSVTVDDGVFMSRLEAILRWPGLSAYTCRWGGAL